MIPPKVNGQNKFKSKSPHGTLSSSSISPSSIIVEGGAAVSTMIAGAFVELLIGEPVGTLQDEGGKAEYLHIDCALYEINQPKKYVRTDFIFGKRCIDLCIHTI